MIRRIMTKLLWQPSESRIKDANITQFILFVNNQFGTKLEDYHDLYNWSVTHTEDFWRSVWEFTNIKYSKNFGSVVNHLEQFPPKTDWFIGARLNFAENLLRYQDDQPALVFYGEQTGPKELTYKELYKKVSQVASSLRQIGVSTGDRVVGYMPNIIETVVAMLATTSIGAVWSSCGSELGVEAAADRLGQVDPKIMFTVDAYWYKGQVFDQIEKARTVAKSIPNVEQIIAVPFVNESFESSDDIISFQDFLSAPSVIEFEQLSFNHPLYIMFSSGTTGKPKCMVQSAGGILINHLKELVLHSDLRRTDKILYLASPSWMMWNWTVSSLAVGATIVLYDGNPMHPSWKRIWEIIEGEEVTVFGCSASYLHYLKTINAQPGKEFNLQYLKEISQTGSTLSEEGFEYVYKEIKNDLHFNSISGGTDINGCFAAGSPTLPVYSGQLQARALGMRVKAYDENMKEVVDQQGELVCELPGPSMPIYFWNDEDNQKYNNAYFNYYEDRNVWRHGDYIKIDGKTRGVMFFGRSDAVLKPSGVRIGTSEIYSIIEELDEVEDSLAIGQSYMNDQRIILFVKLTQDQELNSEIEQKIKNELRTKASPRHVPAIIVKTPDIPYTFSGKKVESAVTNILHGRSVTNRGAIRNPEVLDFYTKMKTELSS